MQFKGYSIKDLERITGIKAHTIRIWEKRYNIIQPQRTETNIRYYCDEDLKKLLNVCILNKYGIKISHIANLDSENLKEKVLNLSHESLEIESKIEKLIITMLEFDEQKFEKLLNTSILSIGFEKTVIELLHPFFEKIGILWQTGAINPSQEHFVSNIIRQKLLVAIENLSSNMAARIKTFVLYLPENEYHELGLLFYYYLIRKRGHKVIYLGQSVPDEGLSQLKSQMPVDVVLTSITACMAADEISSYLNRVKEIFPDQKIITTGYMILNHKDQVPSGIHVAHSVDEFKETYL